MADALISAALITELVAAPWHDRLVAILQNTRATRIGAAHGLRNVLMRCCCMG